ncbi:centriolar and ciliogenesis-associated protein HYSL1 [Ictalurus punctatus]|uniref:Centriolar and ciliogenesis-associated protein HYSL1 n=1 Tax=Ictalurus punctatus TaxID=7998 RepID=A0A2D0RSV8_ICTPU|nr:centriolar and ciliogenesis-associated protein HYSL1 [Ictalurus punctatus]
MENLDFSEEEIQEQLAVLGYTNITKERLREFKQDLDLLIRHEKSRSSTSAERSSPESHRSSSKSPPAFTKEKVQVPGAGSKYSYIYSSNRAADQHRQVLTSIFDDENRDSYIKHSVAPRCMRPSTAPNRLEVEDASSDVYPSVLGAGEPVRQQRDLHTNAKPALKRKVLRKHRGHSQVCDESTYSEDSEPVSEMEERLDHLRVSAPHARHDSYSESEETGSYSDRRSSATVELPSAFQFYIKGMTRSRSENDIRPRPKSFIRPVMDHPHTRNLKKSDPVAKYFQYKHEWETFKAAGEIRRKELHWAIRDQLAYQPPPPKPQRTYIPNTYVVPTEKKRSSLRWEIRHDLANGIIPAKATYL